jgi:hypothetical protein
VHAQTQNGFVFEAILIFVQVPSLEDATFNEWGEF